MYRTFVSGGCCVQRLKYSSRSFRYSNHVRRSKTHVSPSRRSSSSWASYRWKSLGPTAISLTALSVFGYSSPDGKALMLDSRSPYNAGSFESEFDIQELTPWVPYSMDYVEEFFRLRQYSVPVVGINSGILRLDVAQAESNLPPEDTMDHAAIVENSDRQWFIMGAYDGHW